MDDIKLQSNQNPIVTPVQPQATVIVNDEAMRRHQRKIKRNAIIIIVLLVAIVGLVFLYIKHKQSQPLTTADTLTALTKSSAPVTATTAERAATLGTLSGGSRDTARTEQGQKDMLNKLN